MNLGRLDAGRGRKRLMLSAFAAACTAAAWVGCANGTGDDAPPCVCPGGAPCIDGGCGVPPLEPESGTGLHARIVALGDGTTAAVSRDLGRGGLAIVFHDDTGTLLARRHVDVERGTAAAWPAMAAHEGRLHLVWASLDDGTVSYTEGTRAAGFGPVAQIDGGPEDRAGMFASIAVAPDGVVHVAYRAETARALRYAVRQPGEGWKVQVIEPCPESEACHPADRDPGHHASLALTPEPGGAWSPRIAYHDAASGELLLATRGGERWRVSILDGGQGAGQNRGRGMGRFVRMAVTPTRSLVVTYHDDLEGGLRLIRPGSSSRLLDAGLTTLEDGRSVRRRVGEFAALHVDGDGASHIVHLDATRLEWRYLRVEGERVTVDRVVDGLGPGVWADLTSDALGVVGVIGAFDGSGALSTTLRWFRP